MTPYPNVIVFGQTLEQILELGMQNFLHTNNIDVTGLDVISNSIFSNAPTIACFFISVILQSDVESSPTQLCRFLLLNRKGHQRYK